MAHIRLLVVGGGGGAWQEINVGGAGGFVYQNDNYEISTASTINITVGGGGIPQNFGDMTGGDSSFGDIVCPGGTIGYGMISVCGINSPDYWVSGAIKITPPPVPWPRAYAGGGGPGYGANGNDATDANPLNPYAGNGGGGITSDISGTTLGYGGGGGGGNDLSNNGSGVNGGANGIRWGNHIQTGTDGQGVRGGGGGGGSTNGHGGVGVVIIRFTTSQFSNISVTGGTTTTLGNETIISFTNTGTNYISFTPYITTEHSFYYNNKILSFGDKVLKNN